MASSRYDDDYEEMLVEYFQDNTRKKPEAAGNGKGFRPEDVYQLAGDGSAGSPGRAMALR